VGNLLVCSLPSECLDTRRKPFFYVGNPFELRNKNSAVSEQRSEGYYTIRLHSLTVMTEKLGSKDSNVLRRSMSCQHGYVLVSVQKTIKGRFDRIQLKGYSSTIDHTALHSTHYEAH
jgi:hypothetical protein